MLGIEQAGIAETIDFILNHYSADLQTALVQVPVSWLLVLLKLTGALSWRFCCFLVKAGYQDVDVK